MQRTLGVAVDGVLAVALRHAAVDALKGEAAQAQEVLQHVQHYLELAEYQHLCAHRSSFSDTCILSACTQY